MIDSEKGVVMRNILYILFLILSFAYVSPTQAQTSAVSARIVLNEKHTKLRDVLRKIERQSPYLFLYNETQLNMDRRVTINIASVDINQVLDELFEPLYIRYEMMDVQILLMPRSYDKKAKESPSFNLTGYVIDENGYPMEYVSVFDLRSNNGILTDKDGYFQLLVVGDSTSIQFSHLAYEPQVIPVSYGEPTLNVQLTPTVIGLEEVVAIGYGTIARRELTSAVGHVSAERFLSGKVNNPIQSIRGLIPGLSISGSSVSDVNSEPDIQIRGAGSILAGNTPLIVVDGVPGISLNSISPAEIASISVLKDGSSAAIYGSNGANGVILITTKNAKGSDKLLASYQTYVSASKEYNRPRVLSAEQFVAEGRDTDMGYQTDWYDLLMRNLPLEQNHDLSIQNGWQTGAFRFSLNYKDAQGLDIVSTRREYAARTHINQSLLNNHLDLTISLAYKKQDLRLGNHTAFKDAIQANPTSPVYSEDGEYIFPSGFNQDNPVAALKEENRQQENEFFTGSLTAKVNWAKSFYSTVILAENREVIDENVYWTSKAKESVDNDRNGRASRSYSKYISRTLEWTNDYETTWNQHTMKLMAGYSYQRWEETELYAENADFLKDEFTWNDLGSGTYLTEGLADMSSSKSSSKLISLFARVNYSFRDLLMLSASFRREGSSKFGTNHKWGNFPAISGGIRLTELPFFKKDWLDDLKVRAGYGESGRYPFSSYQSLSTYSGSGMFKLDGKWVQVFGPSNNANADLRWEKSLHTNLGADATFLNSSLSLSLNIFKRTTKDLLFSYDAIQPPMIEDQITTNVGTIDSKGVEWEVTWRSKPAGSFRYSTTLTGSYLRSILRSLSNDEFQLGYTYLYELPTPGQPGYAYLLQEGKPIGSFYGWRYAGVDEDGNILIWNKDGEKISTSDRTEEDKAIIGNGVPKVQLSLNNSFKWKDFDLSLFFTSWLGYDILNLKQMYFGLQNVPVINLLEDAYTRNAAIKDDKIYCDYFIENGNFLKLEELTLGYNVPLKDNKWIQSLRFYFSVNNVFTLTGYTGTDPSNINVNGVTPGIETTDIYPVARTFTLGASVQF